MVALVQTVKDIELHWESMLKALNIEVSNPGLPSNSKLIISMDFCMCQSLSTEDDFGHSCLNN